MLARVAFLQLAVLAVLMLYHAVLSTAMLHEMQAQYLQRLAKEILANAKGFFSQSFALARWQACHDTTAGTCVWCKPRVVHFSFGSMHTTLPFQCHSHTLYAWLGVA